VEPGSKLRDLAPDEVSRAAAGVERADLKSRLIRALFGQSFLSGVLRSFLTLAVGEWIARLIGVAIQIWLARELTPGPYGVITFGIALIGWFGLVVDSGTEQLNVREISRHPERFRELADAVLGLRLALSIGAAAVLGVVTYFFSNSADARHVLPRFALVLPALAINLRWMVLGIGKARAVAYGNIASRIVFLVAIVLLVKQPSHDARVPILEALSEATYAIVIIVLAAKAYGVVRPRIDLAAWRSTLTEGFPLLVYGACRATILTADVVLIALILGHGKVGLYGAALKPVAFFLGALGLFSVALLSGYSAAPDSETSALFRRSVLLGSVSMVGVAVALSAGSPLVTFVFGHNYAGAAAPVAVLAWTLPLAGLAVPYSSVLVARNRQDVLMHNNIVGAVFNIGANAIAITFAGITAAAAVRVATYAIMLFLNHNACVKRDLAPSLSTVFAGRLPRLVPRRGRV
jgi:O-antigen/teichoic acid export membrane protein